MNEQASGIGDALICLLWLAFPLWLLLLPMIQKLQKPPMIDSSVKNRIIAHDGNGRFLVEAKTSRQITGPRPYVEGNLPAHLTQVENGLWVVNNGHYEEGVYHKTEWIPVEGNYHIEPRGNTDTPGALVDIVDGWKHNYIQKDGEA